jgi:hypothetical protein
MLDVDTRHVEFLKLERAGVEVLGVAGLLVPGNCQLSIAPSHPEVILGEAKILSRQGSRNHQ